MSKVTLLCESDSHLFHKWSEWSIETAICTKGILFGKHAGEEFEEQVRVRRCEWCKQVKWKKLW